MLPTVHSQRRAQRLGQPSGWPELDIKVRYISEPCGKYVKMNMKATTPTDKVMVGMSLDRRGFLEPIESAWLYKISESDEPKSTVGQEVDDSLSLLISQPVFTSS
jgi:hypothetical protein